MLKNIVKFYKNNFLFHKTLNMKMFNNKIDLKFNNSNSDDKIRHDNNLKAYVDYFRSKSHKYANIYPLNIRSDKPSNHFTLSKWGLSEIEKIDEFPLDDYLIDSNISNLNTIKELENFLTKIYMNKIGIEFSHIDDENEKKWLYENYEKIMLQDLENTEFINAFKIGYPIELFESFLNIKFASFKRYSGEGINSLFIGLFSLLSECSLKTNNVKEVVIDMQHRGRLNLLPFLMDYPLSSIFHRIAGKRDIPANIQAIDDVVSHVSTSNKKLFYSKGNIKDYEEIVVTMVHNPSHLEAACPVSMGKCLAKINDYNENAEKVLNIHIHGDAALSGQGVNYEMLNFNKTIGCDIGGSIHIVSNNQIGYTTDMQLGRSTLYCTDIFKAFDCPIIHVNAEEVESVIKIFKFSLMYKEMFKKDFVIDLIGYRKYGHNEVDEPSFTQPIMYKKIRATKSYMDNFKEEMKSKNIISEEYIKTIENRFTKILNDEYTKGQNLEITESMIRSENYKGNKTLTKKWAGRYPIILEMEFPQNCEKDYKIKTGIERSLIAKIVNESVKVPKEFNLHPRLKQYFVDSRISNLEKGTIDWPTAESLAIGSLLNEKFNVRISGEDVIRGTFSQRHIGFYDQISNDVYFPFKNNSSLFGGRLDVNNSILSEYAMMLFDYGYSLESPKNLVLWEAQFGDFFNGAQIAIDQFLSSGEAKWLRQSSMVLLLPHGYDGAGPEHSNCRIERFLQNTVSNGIDRFYKGDLPDNRSINYGVCNLTTPSNYFHILRRQMLRRYRKPLVIATPKVGLRHPFFTSKLDYFDESNIDSNFKPILVNKFYKDKNSLRNVIFCTGQIIIELMRLIKANGKKMDDFSLVIIRIEEIAPFPEDLILNELHEINKNTKFYWLQEEGMNAGAYTYAEPHLSRIANKTNLNDITINYIGRNAEVAANGSLEIYKKENESISQSIMNLLNNYNV